MTSTYLREKIQQRGFKEDGDREGGSVREGKGTAEREFKMIMHLVTSFIIWHGVRYGHTVFKKSLKKKKERKKEAPIWPPPGTVKEKRRRCAAGGSNVENLLYLFACLSDQMMAVVWRRP